MITLAAPRFILTNSYLVLLLCGQPVKCLNYIHYELFPELESTMIGVSFELRKPDLTKGKLTEIDTGNVVEEMKMFGKECKKVRFSLHPYPL